MKKSCIIILILLMILTGCSKTVDVSVTPTVTAVDIYVPTPTPVPVTPTHEPTPIPTPTPTPVPEDIEIVIGVTGDIMTHIREITDAGVAGGDDGYSFMHFMTYIKDACSYPDLMMGNLELAMAGPETEYTGYPRFNAPDELVPALQYAGFDVVTQANNHIMDRAVSGAMRTLDVLDEYGLAHDGLYRSFAESLYPLVMDIEGIKVGIISGAYGINLGGYMSSEQKEYMINDITVEEIKERIRLCKAFGAELIIVSPHWGYEYVRHPSGQQKNLAKEYIKMGADIIVGHHPHVLQPAEFMTVELEDGTERQGFVFWSMGNFVSNMKERYHTTAEEGAIGYITVTKDGITGELSLSNPCYLPTWVHCSSTLGDSYHVLPVGQFLDSTELQEELGLGRSSMNSLERAWRRTTELFEGFGLTVLREAPTRDDEE